MKKHIKILLIHLILCLNNLSWGQNYSTYQIKEQYDKHNNFLVDIGYHPCNISPSNIADSYGDGMSYVLESYIKMYQTTKDKAYLIKFINNSICIFENRKDDLGISTEPRWGNSSMYQDGLIMWPMAHFYHLIWTEEPSLASLVIPQIPNTKITNNSFNSSFPTYGDYANWIRNRIDQTLVWYTYTEGYWGDDGRCYTPDAHPSSSTRAQVINQQAGFACTLFYLGETDPNTDYSHKAARIGLAHKGSYIEKHPISGCSITSSHSYPVLKLLSNNSYVWKTNGWREVTCNEFQAGTNDYEDISHAVQVLIFPRAIHNKLTSSGNMIFDDNDMVRFKNMFLYNIFAGYTSGCPQFHSGIDGDDVCNYNHAFDGLNTKKNTCIVLYAIL